MHLKSPLFNDILQRKPGWTDDIGAYRRAFRHLPRLVGQKVALRAPRLSDARAFYAYASDKRMCRYVLWDAHSSLWDSRRALLSMIAAHKQGDPATFAIEHLQEGIMVGTIGFQWIDCQSGHCEVGYSIARRLWNQGLASEALKLLVNYAFTALPLQRVQARYDVDNPASGRVMLRAGMQEEGIAEQSQSIRGRMADMMCCAILRTQWEAGQAALCKEGAVKRTCVALRAE